MLFRCKNCRSICHVYGLSASFPHKEILKYKSTKHTKYREYKKNAGLSVMFTTSLPHPHTLSSKPTIHSARWRALAIFETIKTQCGCAVALWLLVVCMCWFSRVMDRAVKLASHTNSYCCYNNISTGWINLQSHKIILFPLSNIFGDVLICVPSIKNTKVLTQKSWFRFPCPEKCRKIFSAP